MEIITIILIVSFIAILISLFIYWGIKPRMVTKKLVAKEAFFFHQDLGRKIELLEDDPSVTDEEWEKMFEISKFADERFLHKCQNKIQEFQSLAEIVAEIIEERKESK